MTLLATATITILNTSRSFVTIERIVSPPKMRDINALQIESKISHALQTTKRIIDIYSKLSETRKAREVRLWAKRVAKRHLALEAHAGISDGRAVPITDEMDKSDLSKVDVLLMSDGYKPIFHANSERFRAVYNCGSMERFKISTQKPFYGAKAAFRKPLIMAGSLSLEDVFSFDPEVKTSLVRFQIWVKSNKLLRDL
jgi:hypothetical protein